MTIVKIELHNNCVFETHQVFIFIKNILEDNVDEVCCMNLGVA